MPATEQTRYDLKLMHRIFAASSVVLLGSTIWMFVADHRREWKQHQRTFRKVEMQMTAWRTIQYETDRAQARYQKLRRALEQAQSKPIDAELLEQFKQAVIEREQDRAVEEGRQAEPYNFSAIDRAAGQLRRAAAEAAAARERADKWRAAARRADNEAAAAKLAAHEARRAIGASADRRQARHDAEASRQKADALVEKAQRLHRKAAAAQQRATGAMQAAADQWERLLAELKGIVDRALFREESAERERKFASAKLGVAKAEFGLAVRDNRPPSVFAQLQRKIDRLAGQTERWTARYEAAKEHRQKLQKILKQITQEVDEADKALQDSRAELERLERANVERRSTWFTSRPPFLGKRWLELPILDAFNSPLRIDNLWDENNKIDYNFGRVRRFDRCTTCHQAMQKTMPGSATEPAYGKAHDLEFVLKTPSEQELPEPQKGPDGKPLPLTLEQVYGIRLADTRQYLLDRHEVTISFVQPYSPDDSGSSLGAQAMLAPGPDRPKPQNGLQLRCAALQSWPEGGVTDRSQERPGLQVGDVLLQVNQDIVRDRSSAIQLLLTGRGKHEWGQSIRLRVRRGLPHPYTSHPRLDLFVGSLSPHRLSVFGCTICHEGQGSATAFKWASHFPNTPRQQRQWAYDYGWFDNPHWGFPMYPRRFVESGCLKCHHGVTELEPSQRFPDPPAPKLVRGYHLIRKYGCYGCHEINGYAGPNQRIGPDLRPEPNFFAVAQQLKLAPGTGYENLSDEERNWIDQLIEHPERDAVRHRLRQMILEDKGADTPRLSHYVHETLEPLLKDVETPGRLRRAGPSLRFVRHKLTEAFLYDFIRQPKRFRPDTRMPQVFGLWNHLEGASRELSERLEPVEILGIVTYLLDRSQAFTYIEPPSGISSSTREAKIARGKILFQQRGCLACHRHKAFDDAEAYRAADEIIQGPNLSGVAAKFAHPEGRRWLYSWIRNPSRYHVRTRMPNLFLEPIVHKDRDGKVVQVTDPAADIVAFLLAESRSDWEPAPGTLTEAQLADDPSVRQTLDDMVLMNLKEGFSARAAERYLAHGIPAELAGELKGPERELLGDGMTAHKKLLYVGHKAIGKYGCFGCHDIAGFEGAKPIGTALADWGRKDPTKLAFNYIVNYLENHKGGGEGASRRPGEQQRDGMFSAEDLGFYRSSLKAGHRAGFIYQKLREPRSYDYHDTENKRYNERLRMPQFPLNDEEREAIITFVLGLVADPPAPKFVYQPDPHQRAIIEGRQVLAQYNCAGCHMLELEKWKIAYPPGTFGAPYQVATFPFVRPNFPPDQLAESTRPDRQGRLHATLVGLPALDNADGLPLIDGEFEGELEPLDPETDYDPTTLEYYFDLYEPAALDGAVREVGVQTFRIPTRLIERRYPTRGGFLAKYLVPYVVQRDKAQNPGAKARGKEAWGWLPPPLVGQGAKVQSSWLHQFLLDPQPIRPAALLRMPRFNLSPQEATKLVNYFAAASGADYPYQFNRRTQRDHLAAAEQRYQQLLARSGAGRPPSGSRFDHAMKIITDKQNGCLQCHILGNYRVDPKGPDLLRVYRRLRPEFLRRWIARPASILPYTSMPDNFKYLPETPDRDGFVVPGEDGTSMKYVLGTSTEQIDAVVDLLMNFDRYSLQRSSTSVFVEAGAPPGGGRPPGAADEATGGAR